MIIWLLFYIFSGHLYGVEISTKPEKGEFFLNIVKDRHDSKVSFDYAVKWDFKDISGMHLKDFYAGLAFFGKWDIIERTRIKFSVYSLLDDLTENFEDQMGELLVDETLRQISPRWRGVSMEGKRMFIRDILSLEIWELELLGAPRESLESFTKD
ncbi:MAG: hypothetical protein HY746_04610 [Elusimicrobia bacterium]|nr:hypothetical protein [Elusimicrobiota bacterium]